MNSLTWKLLYMGCFKLPRIFFGFGWLVDEWSLMSKKKLISTYIQLIHRTYGNPKYVHDTSYFIGNCHQNILTWVPKSLKQFSCNYVTILSIKVGFKKSPS